VCDNNTIYYISYWGHCLLLFLFIIKVVNPETWFKRVPYKGASTMHQNWCTGFNASYLCGVQVLYDSVHSILNTQILSNILILYVPCIADPSGHTVYGVGPWPLACWDCGFETHWEHRCLSFVSVVCCQVAASALGWSFIQRSPTKCCVSEWLWTLDKEEALPHWNCCTMVKSNVPCILWWLVCRTNFNLVLF